MQMPEIESLGPRKMGRPSAVTDRLPPEPAEKPFKRISMKHVFMAGLVTKSANASTGLQMSPSVKSDVGNGHRPVYRKALASS